MAKNTGSSEELEFLRRAVTALAGASEAKKALPLVEEAYAMAREGSSPGLADDLRGLSSRVRLSVDGPDTSGPQVVTGVFSAREPVDAGPKKRKPIRVGGGSCFTITIGKRTYTICVDWEQTL